VWSRDLHSLFFVGEGVGAFIDFVHRVGFLFACSGLSVRHMQHHKQSEIDAVRTATAAAAEAAGLCTCLSAAPCIVL
jgi:hypothetical protein